jgi:SHS2 domain-containing protein
MDNVSVAMPEQYDYFEHEADVGIIGRGETVEAAFEAAAAAMFAIMVDLSMIRPETRVCFDFEEQDLEFALITWLNRLLAEARSSGMIFGRFALSRRGQQWSGEAWGEPWRPDLDRGVEVKGATLTMLSVRQTATGWEARCVVDV